MIGRHGTAAVELALMLPVLLLTLLSGADLARAALARAEGERAIRAMARFAAGQTVLPGPGAVLAAVPVPGLVANPDTIRLHLRDRREAGGRWVIVTADLAYRPLTPFLERLLDGPLWLGFTAVEASPHARP